MLFRSVLGSLELIAEAYTIAEKSGIGQDLVYEYIKGGPKSQLLEQEKENLQSAKLEPSLYL